MADRLNGISSFVEAVEAGSFSQAAERLHLSRTAVGKSIARLENRLGVRLFHRTTRSQKLTQEGAAYYERCVRALAELNAGLSAIDSGRTEPTGCLRVTAPVLLGRHCVAPVLLALGRKYPKLRIEISFDDRVVDIMEERFDLAVRIGNIPDSSTLIAKKLGIQRMVVCASPSYLARRGKPTKIEELAGHDGIFYGRSGIATPWRIQSDEYRVDTAPVAARYVFDDLQTITDAAVAGDGLAWLPCWLMAKHKQLGELEIVMGCDSVIASDISVVWPQSNFLPTKTRLAIDILAAEIPGRVGQAEDVDGT
jgi:DNA-binding transcriptional LysR family regulator